MNKALIIGCSHAAGSEMLTDPNDPMSADYGYTHSYPVFIAQGLGLTPYNHSIPGGSNDAMFRIFQNNCKQLDTTDVVIACWTGCNRSEIWHDGNQCWLPLGVGKTWWSTTKPDNIILEGRFTGQVISNLEQYQQYYHQWIKFHISDEVGRLNKIKNIVALNSLAQSIGIRVINIDSFWPVLDYDSSWPTDISFWDWCVEKKYPRTEMGHFFLPAHTDFATMVLERIHM